jgi:hypothetical protein
MREQTPSEKELPIIISYMREEFRELKVEIKEMKKIQHDMLINFTTIKLKVGFIVSAIGLVTGSFGAYVAKKFGG